MAPRSAHSSLIAHALGACAIALLGVAALPAAALGQVGATLAVSVRAAAPGLSSDTLAGDGSPGPRPPDTGAPVVGASVTLAGAGVITTTGEDGRAFLTGVSPGRHTIVVRSLGYHEASVELDAANARVTRAVVNLAPLPMEVLGLTVSARSADLPPGGVAIEPADLSADVFDLAGAIDRVPGASVVRHGGPGAPVYVQLRGSAADQVLVLLDGVPINSPVTGLADLSTVDLQQLERIVVVPGAASSRYGPRALGGVVLLESRAPRGSDSSAMISLGSWSSRGLSGAAAVASGRWLASGNARWSRSRGDFTYRVPDFRGGGEAARVNAGHKQTAGDLTLTRTDMIDLSVHAHASVLERGSPGPVAQPSITGLQRHRRTGGSLRASAGARSSGLAMTFAARSQRAEYSDTAPPFGPPYDARTVVGVGQLTLEGWLQAGPLSVRAGGEASSQDVESTSLGVPSTLVHVAGGWGRVEYTTVFGRSWGFTATAGTRFDYHDLVDGATISPSLRVALRRGAATFDASWGRAFSPPGLGDLFFQEGVLVEPNPELRPERVRNQLELGASQRWHRAENVLEGRVRAYRADAEDMILWFPDHRFVWSPRNFDVGRRGVELGATARWGLFGANHSVSVDAEWTQVEYRGPALAGQVAYRPVWSGSASLGVELSGVTVTPTIDYVGARRSVPGSQLNELPAYALLDIGLRVPFQTAPIAGHVDVTLTNALDAHAALLVDYPLPSRGWTARVRITPSH